MKFPLPFALLLLLGLPAHAEQPVPELQYQSVFDGYQAYADPEIKNWPEAIQLVDEIGGWRGYAREPFENKLDGSAGGKTSEKPVQQHQHGAHNHGHHHGGAQ